MPAESSRLIPAAARSILVVVTTTDGRRLGEQFSTRPFTGEKQTPPTDTAFFPDLPAGPVLVLASAFPSDDGTGVPQATGSLTTTVVANQKTRTPPLTMGTTIVKVQIDVPGVTLTPGQSTQVSVSTLDAQNNLVLTAPGVLAWKIEGIAGVSVTPTGNPATVTAAADAQAGSGSLSVTEPNRASPARRCP
jgi:hypothetical protein